MPVVYTLSDAFSLNKQHMVVSVGEGVAYPPSGTKVNGVFVGTDVELEGTIMYRGTCRSRITKGVLPVMVGLPVLFTPSNIGECYGSLA